MYITPGFKFEQSKKEKLGFLLSYPVDNVQTKSINSYQTRTKNTANPKDDVLAIENTTQYFKDSTGIVLTNGPKNKFWYLMNDGSIILDY